MEVNPKAGKPAEAAELVNVPKLISAYFSEHPDASMAEQRVSFGTSGHSGSALRCSFNQDHILAISQAIRECRKRLGWKARALVARALRTHAAAG